ncbi:MAG: hypothetical protein GF400_11275 [Candidatus Eisenbacteria bacterium]|nr:hypothetical protein [Candidatus Eisenbacteria bacterium]
MSKRKAAPTARTRQKRDLRAKTEAVLGALGGCARYVVTAHVRPDGDSLGSALATARWLRSGGRETLVVMRDGVPEQFAFLPDAGLISRQYPGDPSEWAVVVLDTPDPGRTGAPEGYLEAARTVINVDHHPGNAHYGDANLVDTCASSASLLVYELMSEAGHAPDGETATLLYAGVLTDTGGFRFGNTDARTFRTAARLVEAGAEAPWVAKHVYGEQPTGRLRLLGLVLASLESELGGRLAIMTLTDRMREEAGVSGENIEGLASYGHLLRDVEVSALLREEGERVRVSLRSSGEADVNEIAGMMGGGGHRAAAGAALPGPMAEARERLIAAVASSLERR